jgi:hypothetical protein
VVVIRQVAIFQGAEKSGQAGWSLPNRSSECSRKEASRAKFFALGSNQGRRALWYNRLSIYRSARPSTGSGLTDKETGSVSASSRERYTLSIYWMILMASGPCWRGSRNSHDAEPLPRARSLSSLARSPTFGTPYPVAAVVAAGLCLPLPRSLSLAARHRQ